MHYFDHTIDNRIKFFYFIRSLLPPKSPILAKYWWGPLYRLGGIHNTLGIMGHETRTKSLDDTDMTCLSYQVQVQFTFTRKLIVRTQIGQRNHTCHSTYKHKLK